MLVTTGTNFWPMHIAVGGGAISVSCKAGTSNAATTLSMTDMQALVATATPTLSTINGLGANDTLEADASFGPGGAYTTQEYGIFYNSSMMWRVVGPASSKLNGEYINVSFRTRQRPYSSSPLVTTAAGNSFIPLYVAAGGGAISTSVKIGTSAAATTSGMTDLVAPLMTSSTPNVSSSGDILSISTTFSINGTYTINEYGYFLTSAATGEKMRGRFVGPPTSVVAGDFLSVYMSDQFSDWEAI